MLHDPTTFRRVPLYIGYCYVCLEDHLKIITVSLIVSINMYCPCMSVKESINILLKITGMDLLTLENYITLNVSCDWQKNFPSVFTQISSSLQGSSSWHSLISMHEIRKYCKRISFSKIFKNNKKGTLACEHCNYYLFN